MENYTDIYNVFGRRGCGKSTLGNGLVKDAPKVLAMDPQRERIQGWLNCRTRGDVVKAVQAQWQSRVRVAYSPDASYADMVQEGAWLASLAITGQAHYRTTDPRPLVLLYDEAHMSYPNHALPKGAGALNYVTLQGRHDGIGMVLISQRPAMLNTNPRGNARKTYAFSLVTKNDRAAVAEINEKAAPILECLKKHQAVEVDDWDASLINVKIDGSFTKSRAKK